MLLVQTLLLCPYYFRVCRMEECCHIVFLVETNNKGLEPVKFQELLRPHVLKVSLDSKQLSVNYSLMWYVNRSDRCLPHPPQPPVMLII